MKILCAISFLLLMGCNQQRRAHNYYSTHRLQFAQACAEAFPVKDSVIVRDSIRFDTLYLETAGVVIKDSFFIKGDTVVRYVVKQCPPAKIITKTIRHDSTIIRPDAAKETGLQLQINALQTNYTQARQQVKSRTEFALWVLLLLILENLVIFRKQIFRL